jgi:hypothetical protein
MLAVALVTGPAHAAMVGLGWGACRLLGLDAWRSLACAAIVAAVRAPGIEHALFGLAAVGLLLGFERAGYAPLLGVPAGVAAAAAGNPFLIGAAVAIVFAWVLYGRFSLARCWSVAAGAAGWLVLVDTPLLALTWRLGETPVLDIAIALGALLCAVQWLTGTHRAPLTLLVTIPVVGFMVGAAPSAAAFAFAGIVAGQLHRFLTPLSPRGADVALALCVVLFATAGWTG